MCAALIFVCENLQQNEETFVQFNEIHYICGYETCEVSVRILTAQTSNSVLAQPGESLSHF